MSGCTRFVPAVVACLMVSALGTAACSSGDDAKPAASAIETFVSRAKAEFERRGEKTFFDTGVLSYCRQNTGFDTGVFQALGYSTADAPKDTELCYNVSADRKKVALSATSTTGERTCAVLDSSAGAIVRTDKASGACTP